LAALPESPLELPPEVLPEEDVEPDPDDPPEEVPDACPEDAPVPPEDPEVSGDPAPSKAVSPSALASLSLSETDDFGLSGRFDGRASAVVVGPGGMILEAGAIRARSRGLRRVRTRERGYRPVV
jgi:hypothetical protein